jgi:hypothetical protein
MARTLNKRLTLRVMALSLSMGLIANHAPASDGPNVGAALGDTPPNVAALLFRDICVQTLPGFKKAASALKKAKFNRNTKTGTYYHPDYNLSVKITKYKGSPQCSLVMIGTSEPEQTSYMFAAAVFADVPEAERDQTEVNVPKPGQMAVHHPGFVDFRFDSSPYEARSTLYHAVLSPTK